MSGSSDGSDQWDTIVDFFRGVVESEFGSRQSDSQFTLWWRRCREDLRV